MEKPWEQIVLQPQISIWALDFQFEATINGTTWSTPTPIDSYGDLNSISCVSANFCAAVDNSGNAVTYSGTTWSKPTPIDSNGGGLTSISCASANFCVAVDAVGNVLTGSKDYLFLQLVTP